MIEILLLFLMYMLVCSSDNPEEVNYENWK